MLFDLISTIPPTELNNDNIMTIGQMLTFISTFLSLAIAQTFSRKAFARWRRSLWICLVLQWGVIPFIVLDLFVPIRLQSGSHSLPHLWTVFGILFWSIGLIYLLYIFFMIFNIEAHRYCKDKPDSRKDRFLNYISNIINKKIAYKIPIFESFLPTFGDEKNCLNIVFTDAEIEAKKKNLHKVFYPLILAADECWRPWIIARDFCQGTLDKEKDAGTIWFDFARPFHNNEGPHLNKTDNVIHIDCFNSLRRGRDCIENGVLYADPRNADELNRKYTQAIWHLKEEHGCKKLCVIYDSLSDFLYISDIDMASQFLRTNMAWETYNHVCSLYILRHGVLEPAVEQYVLWFANSIITLKTEEIRTKNATGLEEKESTPIMATSGLFDDPREFRVTYGMDMCEEN